MNEYRKYRWFFTRSGKLVYGGKSAEQNEEIVKALMKEPGERIVMHTKIPGSPFAIIDAQIDKVNPSDLEETAIWTACFSRAWRSALRKTPIDVFKKNQIFKKKGMKNGTFGISGKVERKIVELKLGLINQREVLRAVPLTTIKSNSKIFATITPGKLEKEEFSEKLSKIIGKTKEEVLNALPPGKFKENK